MTYRVEKDWTTEAGLRAVCLYVINKGATGHRCGYVGVPVGHPLHGKQYCNPCSVLSPPADNTPIGGRAVITILCAAGNPALMTAPDIVFDVHGSITFADGGNGYPVSGNEWWFGFDCAHAGDHELSQEFVESECERLATQIAGYPYKSSSVVWI